MTKNWNCDGGQCTSPNGEVRVYPIGGGGNLILCRSCFAHENRARRVKGMYYGRPEEWPQINWATAEPYGEPQSHDGAPKPEMVFWLSDARGIYIPRDFAKSFTDRDKHVSGVSPEDWAVLDAGPDHEHYWDTWCEVCDRAVVTDTKGVKHTLHQDGDLWLIPEGMEWSDEHDTFVATEEEEQ